MLYYQATQEVFGGRYGSVSFWQTLSNLNLTLGQKTAGENQMIRKFPAADKHKKAAGVIRKPGDDFRKQVDLSGDEMLAWKLLLLVCVLATINLAEWINNSQPGTRSWRQRALRVKRPQQPSRQSELRQQLATLWPLPLCKALASWLSGCLVGLDGRLDSTAKAG